MSGCAQAERPWKIGSPGLQVEESCPGCMKSSRGCCATHPCQMCRETPRYFLLHQSALGKQQDTEQWCNSLSWRGARHKVVDTVC